MQMMYNNCTNTQGTQFKMYLGKNKYVFICINWLFITYESPQKSEQIMCKQTEKGRKTAIMCSWHHFIDIVYNLTYKIYI